MKEGYRRAEDKPQRGDRFIASACPSNLKAPAGRQVCKSVCLVSAPAFCKAYSGEATSPLRGFAVFLLGFNSL